MVRGLFPVPHGGLLKTIVLTLIACAVVVGGPNRLLALEAQCPVHATTTLAVPV